MTTPWWFHPLLGAALAAMLAALSLGGPAVAVVLVLALAAPVALCALYRRLTGLWVNTWHVEGMRRITATAVCLLLLALGVGLELGAGARGAAAITGVVYVVYWRWVERRLVALWAAGWRSPPTVDARSPATSPSCSGCSPLPPTLSWSTDTPPPRNPLQPRSHMTAVVDRSAISGMSGHRS